MEKKVTAIEELIQFAREMKQTDVISHRGAYQTIIEYCEKHLIGVEKQQMIDAHDSKFKMIKEEYSIDSLTTAYQSGEGYYNETYGK